MEDFISLITSNVKQTYAPPSEIVTQNIGLDFRNYSKLHRLFFTNKSRPPHQFDKKIITLSPQAQTLFNEKFKVLISKLNQIFKPQSLDGLNLNKIGSQNGRFIRIEIYRLILFDLIASLSQKTTADLSNRIATWRNNNPSFRLQDDPIELLKVQSLDPYQGLLYSFFRDYFLDLSDLNIEIISYKIDQCLPSSLETRLHEFSLKGNIDIWGTYFKDYLHPNETFPNHVAPHLSKMSKGYLVSTGTERAFFNLIYAPEDRCKGLICLDINPRVKAYNDFNVMLIRLCQNVNEYARLSSNIETEEEFNLRLCEIYALIRVSSIPHHAKLYYLKNLKTMGVIFFREERIWRSVKLKRNFHPFNSNVFTNENFEATNYSKNQDQYSKLKRYADAGNIVTITQDIFNLSHLGIKNIGAIDISNIVDYFTVEFNGLNSKALIIYYDFLQNSSEKKYQSYIHEEQEINQCEKEFLKKKIDIHRKTDDQNNTVISGILFRKFLRNIATNQLKVDCSKLKLGLFLTKDNYEFFKRFCISK